MALSIWANIWCPNKVGFYKIKADREKCISCGKCTKECDMGIPVQHLVETKGEVNVFDCVGCGRCVANCPRKALRFSDVRGLLKKAFPSKPPVVEVKPEDKKIYVVASISRAIEEADISMEGRVVEINQGKEMSNRGRDKIEVKVAKGGKL